MVFLGKIGRHILILAMFLVWAKNLNKNQKTKMDKNKNRSWKPI